MIYAINAIPTRIELNIPSTRTPVFKSMQKQHFGKNTFPSPPLPILTNLPTRIVQIIFRVFVNAN